MKIRAAVLEEFAQAAGGAGGRPGRARARARCSCGSSPAASATPTCTPPPASTPPATRRRCSATRAPASSSAPGRASRSLSEGDHVVTLFSPQCRECVHCRSPLHEPLPRDPRAAEPRLPARRHHAPVARRRADAPFHGHLDVRRVHGDARDRAREDRPGGAARSCLPVRLRALDGARRGDAHRRGRGPARPASCSVPAWSASARWPAADCRAPSGSSASTSRRSASSSRAGQGATDLLAGGPDTVERILEMTRRLRRRLHLRGDRQRRRDAPGRRGSAHGLGAVHGLRRRRQGRDARCRSAPADHRPARLRLLVRRSEGPRRRAGARRAATCAARSTWTRSSRTACRSTRSTAASS